MSCIDFGGHILVHSHSNLHSELRSFEESDSLAIPPVRCDPFPISPSHKNILREVDNFAEFQQVSLGMHPSTNANPNSNNSNYTGATPKITTVQQHPEQDLLTVRTGYHDFGSALSPDGRPRSNSFNTRSYTYRHGLVTSPQYQHASPISRLTAEGRLGRTGSADNISIHPNAAHRLTHSNTISEIPPHYSNDSGYDTPPFTKPHTSPSWPSNQVPHWSVPGILSPPPGTVANTAGNQTCQQGTRPGIPTNQGLTVEIGHFEEEPNSPQLVVGYVHHPIQNTPGYREMPASLPSQRSAQQAQEEGVIEYQRQRKERLVQAYHSQQYTLDQLQKELQQLTESFKGECAENGNIGSDTEIEVENLRKENDNLKGIIQKLEADLSQLKAQPIRPVAPLPATPPRPPPPSPQLPADLFSLQWTCPKCTLINHGLINYCEACEAARPPRGNNTNNGGASSLVKTSSCTHQSGCFCHAHLG